MPENRAARLIRRLLTAGGMEVFWAGGFWLAFWTGDRCLSALFFLLEFGSKGIFDLFTNLASDA